MGLSFKINKSFMDLDGEEEKSTGFVGETALSVAERTCDVGCTYLAFPRTLQTKSSLICVKLSHTECWTLHTVGA